jgi:hypothetical protein
MNKYIDYFCSMGTRIMALVWISYAIKHLIYEQFEASIAYGILALCMLKLVDDKNYD